MDNFNELLRPKWGSEKWIKEGWDRISSDEKELIQTRMAELFTGGLPFEIQHDKMLYVYAFSLLAQLEVLAIQIPLKFQDKLSSQESRERMHQQLLDEIFHGLVFTKIIYLLCDPYAVPPEYDNKIELFCNTIRNIECPKVAVTLLNLVAEGWIEEAFKAFANLNIAPQIFATILNDERRHISEADLYRDIGMPNTQEIEKMIEYMEEQFIVNFFMQTKYLVATAALLGLDGGANFLQALNAKHQHQLKKIKLKPGKKWSSFMHIVQSFLPKLLGYVQTNYEIAMTPMRQVLMAQWDNPSDASMFSQFNIDISCIDFFSKKFPPETLTTLMLQTVSLVMKENDLYRTYINFKKFYCSEVAYVGVIVKLPGCQDHMGTIIFANCHELSVIQLAQKIRTAAQMMAYCYQKCRELEQAYPYLKLYADKKFYDFADTIYQYTMPGSSLITVSNIGQHGYTDGKSPLLKNEAMKIVLLQVDRRQVWNKNTHAFEIQDHLPVSMTVDHRVFDGNHPVPQKLNEAFQSMYQKMLRDIQKTNHPTKTFNHEQFIKILETMLSINVEFGYKTLCGLQTVWPDFIELDKLMTPLEKIKLSRAMANMSV